MVTARGPAVAVSRSTRIRSVMSHDAALYTSTSEMGGCTQPSWEQHRLIHARNSHVCCCKRVDTCTMSTSCSQQSAINSVRSTACGQQRVVNGVWLPICPHQGWYRKQVVLCSRASCRKVPLHIQRQVHHRSLHDRHTQQRSRSMGRTRLLYKQAAFLFYLFHYATAVLT